MAGQIESSKGGAAEVGKRNRSAFRRPPFKQAAIPGLFYSLTPTLAWCIHIQLVLFFCQILLFE